MPPSNRTEAENAAETALVERCRQGDPGAFEELYRLHAPRVYSLACRMTGRRADGEDLLQEIFLLVFRKLESFKGEAALGTWIYRLATNCCLDFLRSRKRRDAAGDRGARRGRAAGAAGRAGAARRAHGPRAGDRPTAPRIPGGVRAARRRRVRAPRSGRAARHRGGHVEVAGAQGAAEDPRDLLAARAGDGPDVTANHDLRSRSASARRAAWTATSIAPPARELDAHLRDVRRRAPRSPRISSAMRRASRRLPPLEPPERIWTADRARSVAAPGDRSRGRADGARRGVPLAVAAVLAGGRRHHVVDASRAIREPGRRDARPRRATQPAAPGAHERHSADLKSLQASCSWPKRTTRTRSGLEKLAKDRRVLDPQVAAEAAEEPAGHRLGDRREPRGAQGAAGERTGAGEPLRGVPHEGRAAAGHHRPHQRDAQGQPGRGGADRRRPEQIVTRTRLIVRPMTLALLTLARLASRWPRRRSPAQPPAPPVARIVRVAPERAAWFERYQDSARGPRDRPRPSRRPSRSARAGRSTLEPRRRRHRHRRSRRRDQGRRRSSARAATTAKQASSTTSASKRRDRRPRRDQDDARRPRHLGPRSTSRSRCRPTRRCRAHGLWRHQASRRQRRSAARARAATSQATGTPQVARLKSVSGDVADRTTRHAGTFCRPGP